MRRIKAYLIGLAALLAAGCVGIDRPFEGTFDQVLILCGLGYNNLSGDLRQNLDDLATDVLPGLSNDKAIVVFMHNTAGGYGNPNPPVLLRLFRGRDGKPVRDTLKVYEGMTLSASASSLRTVLEDIRGAFPARRYGMVYSSHGTGWLPAGYNSSSEPGSVRSFAAGAADSSGQAWPETKALGNQYVGSSANVQWVELQELAAALPMKLEYLAIDCCLSGAVEVAWELKDVCDRLVVTPAEVLTAGMIYNTLSRNVFSGPEPDLETWCREFHAYYDAQSGAYRSGTITLVDCTKLDALADAFSSILDARRDALDVSLCNTVQRYYYASSKLRFFYDLRDLAEQLGAGEAVLGRLDDALADCIPYHAETPTFFDLPLERCCGLSVYIPDPGRPQLNDFYRTLSWNRRVGLVE